MALESLTGLAATLLDSATGCAINTMMPPGRIFTTLEMKINFKVTVKTRDREVLCEAHVIHIGGRTATADGRIVDRRGKFMHTGRPHACCFFQRPERSGRGKRSHIPASFAQKQERGASELGAVSTGPN